MLKHMHHTGHMVQYEIIPSRTRESCPIIDQFRNIITSNRKYWLGKSQRPRCDAEVEFSNGFSKIWKSQMGDFPRILVKTLTPTQSQGGHSHF